ncbi:MAG: M20/M25/M40 family metallo-hydrolase [Alistipes sp.]
MNPTEFRRHLHAHPELSFKEHDTAAFIADRLTELGIEHRPIARTGVLAWIEGRGKADPKRRAVVLRADIDALPITEQNDIGWRSCTPGVMHACGHDMHARYFGVLRTRRRTRLPRHALRAVPAGRGVQPGRCVAGAGRKPVRRVRVRAVVGDTSSRNWSRDAGIPRRKYMAPATNCASRCTVRAGTAPCARS